MRAYPKSILAEAEELIHGPRRQSYGDAKLSFSQVAGVWSAILKNHITPEQVALCMIGLKLIREANKSTRDNLVDICGYAALLEKLREEE